jgi:phage gp36-like protein
MTLLSTVYCTEAQVQRFLSTSAVTDFADHDADGSADTGVVDDCINQATEEIDLWLRERYTQTDIATSPLVERWAVVIAARFLCQRRGNVVPDVIEGEFSRILDPDNGMVARIARGHRDLPGIDQRADVRPAWSNLDVDRRYFRAKVRVTKANSSDAETDVDQKTTADGYGAWWD